MTNFFVTLEGDELYTRVKKNLNPSHSKGWTINFIERKTRYSGWIISRLKKCRFIRSRYRKSPKKNIGKSGQPYAGGRLNGRILVKYFVKSARLRPWNHDKSIVSEKAAQIYPDLSSAHNRKFWGEEEIFQKIAFLNLNNIVEEEK